MCYHVSTPKIEKLEQFAKANKLKNIAAIKEEYPHYYHVSGFARPFLPTVLNDSNELSLARWKLLPFWVKNEDEAKKYANTLNAESESIFEKKSYSPFILKHRGLLLVDGFYEPHKVEGVKETENYYLSYPKHEIFTLGVVFAPWTDQNTGEYYNTFSIITTPANKLLTEIHNEKKRMPLIIPADKRRSWLQAETKSEIENLMQPLEDGILNDWKVERVTGARSGNTNLPQVQDKI